MGWHGILTAATGFSEFDGTGLTEFASDNAFPIGKKARLMAGTP